MVSFIHLLSGTLEQGRATARLCAGRDDGHRAPATVPGMHTGYYSVSSTVNTTRPHIRVRLRSSDRAVLRVPVQTLNTDGTSSAASAGGAGAQYFTPPAPSTSPS